jgi:hypothetical protein
MKGVGRGKVGGQIKVLLFLGLFPVVLLGGCTTSLRIHPTLPSSGAISASPSRIGVYMTPTSPDRIKAGSGIWPGTTYVFSTADTMEEGLVNLTKHHFRNAGIAENAGDKKWDYVLEYECQKPSVAEGDLRSKAPLKFTMRNPLTGRNVQSLTLVGDGPPQGGGFFRFFLGRLSEKPALERSLTEAYTSLFNQVDSTLARTAAAESKTTMEKPYRRREPSN